MRTTPFAIIRNPGERVHGRRNIQALRGHHPGKPSGFQVKRILGGGGFWVTEYTITYGGQSVYTISLMEFRYSEVVHETQYFAEAFTAPTWRREWVGKMD
jgi:hypothetical protein